MLSLPRPCLPVRDFDQNLPVLQVCTAEEGTEQTFGQNGNRFDIRGFHDVILGAGALPLPLLHAEVESWIKEVKLASR